MITTYVPNPNAADGAPVTGANNIFRYDGDPNGHVTATGAAIVVGSSNSTGSLWLKQSSGTSNNEWFKVISNI